MTRILALAVLVMLAAASASSGGARIHVVWPDAPGLEAFSSGFGSPHDALGPDCVIVGAERVKTGSWRDLPNRLVEIVTRGRVTHLVVGPDAKLSHLALQLAVKANVRVVLVACPDRAAAELPIRGVQRVPETTVDPRATIDHEALGRQARRRFVR